eukprot:7328876-Prymnesium_polylepis.1
MPAGRASPRSGGARALHSTPARDSGEPETGALTPQSQAQPRCAIADGGVPPCGLGYSVRACPCLSVPVRAAACPP